MSNLSETRLSEALFRFAEMAETAEKQQEELLASRDVLPEEGDNDLSAIWKTVKTRPKTCRSLTGFLPSFINELIVDAEVEAPVPRGRTPTYTLSDGVFCLLAIYHTGQSPGRIASFLLQKAMHALSAAIERARPLVNAVLLRRQGTYRESRPRPGVAPPEAGDVKTTIGLANDCTPIPINRPKMSFNAAKEYFDAHHNIYALKVEVAVATTPPHHALFWSRPQPGAVADVTISRGRPAQPPLIDAIPSATASYVGYLTATPEERSLFSAGGPPYWTLVQDSGFRGTLDVPYPRIITIPLSPSKPTPPSELYYKRRRVVVEQFFGRLKKLCTLLNQPYCLDKSHIQIDIENCIMLTNAHITINALTSDDMLYYRRWLTVISEKVETKREKRVEATAAWRTRQRQRLQEELEAFQGGDGEQERGSAEELPENAAEALRQLALEDEEINAHRPADSSFDQRSTDSEEDGLSEPPRQRRSLSQVFAAAAPLTH